eukprot:scpid6630/ scgid24119/ 
MRRYSLHSERGHGQVPATARWRGLWTTEQGNSRCSGRASPVWCGRRLPNTGFLDQHDPNVSLLPDRPSKCALGITDEATKLLLQQCEAWSTFPSAKREALSAVFAKRETITVPMRSH